MARCDRVVRRRTPYEKKLNHRTGKAHKMEKPPLAARQVPALVADIQARRSEPV